MSGQIERIVAAARETVFPIELLDAARREIPDELLTSEQDDRSAIAEVMVVASLAETLEASIDFGDVINGLGFGATSPESCLPLQRYLLDAHFSQASMPASAEVFAARLPLIQRSIQ
jgi:hypothetical protein